MSTATRARGRNYRHQDCVGAHRVLSTLIAGATTSYVGAKTEGSPRTR